MKLAIIVNSFPSISEKFLLNQIISISKIDKNIDFTIFAGVKSLDKKQHSLFQNPIFSNRIINLNIPRAVWKRYLYLPILFFICFFRSPKYTFRSFSIKHYNKTAINLKNLFFLKYFNKCHYDIIHCHFGQNGLIGAFLKDCNFCNKLIVTFHGTDITTISNNYSPNIYRYMFTRVDHITSGSNFIKNKIIEHGGNNITIIPMGIDVSPLTTTSNRYNFLSIGRLVDVKGFIYSIAAFKIISKNFPSCNYLIAGNGPLYFVLQNEISKNNLLNRIILLKDRTSTELETLFSTTLALIVPSIRSSDGSEEGQCLVIQEAAIQGIPSIGTNTGGIPEGIINGSTGWIVQEKNSISLSEKMNFFLENPEQSIKMGNNAYNYAVKEYDNIKIVTDLINNVYYDN